MKPFFSIILPTFNQANFLKNCLQTILKQTYKNWELIIIDNNSIDNTQKVIKTIKDNRIKLYKINNNGLLSKSRNLGIKKSQAEWICFIDSDDKWFPNKLYETKKYINKYNGDLYYHDLIFDNKRFFFQKKIYDKSNTIKKPILKYFSKKGNPIGQSSVVVKKNILKKINYISENKKKFSWEDFDTWIKVAKITDKFIRIPKVLGSIWIGPENISNLERQIINSINIKKYYYKIFNKFLSSKEKNKNLWWIEYPFILKDFKEKKIENFLDRLKNISDPPIKFSFIFFYMKINLLIFKKLRFIKKIFSPIILFKNKKEITDISVKNMKYNIIKNLKNLKKIKFDNFTITQEIINRIKKKYQFHFIFQQKKILAYGWSSSNKKFLIYETNSEILNKDNIIFFDFFTLIKFRNKGIYKLLLNKMLNNFNKKKCYIYTTIFNFKSLKSIMKSNFEFVNFYTIFRNKINLSE